MVFSSQINEKVDTVRGWTPLHLTVVNGLVEETKKVLSLGAQIDAVDQDGKTPFIVALEAKIDVNAKEEIIKIFLGQGIKLNYPDSKKNLPLFYVTELSIAELLVKNGACHSFLNNGKEIGDLLVTKFGAEAKKRLPQAKDGYFKSGPAELDYAPTSKKGSEEKECPSCTQPFGFSRWRQDCTKCGLQYCSECSKKTANFGSSKGNRVCQMCYNILLVTKTS